MRFLLLIFIVVPVTEMWLLIQVGSAIGAWPTIGLVFLTAIIGLSLLRREGLKTLLRSNRKLEAGELPAGEMVEGLILAVSGALLLTPGFATDFFGFLGLFPWSRQWLVKYLLAKGTLHAGVFQHRGFTARQQDNGGKSGDRIIEAEYWEDKKDNRE